MPCVRTQCITIIDKRNGRLQTPLHLAVSVGNLEMVRLLLEFGARAALRAACNRDSPEETNIPCAFGRPVGGLGGRAVGQAQGPRRRPRRGMGVLASGGSNRSRFRAARGRTQVSDELVR